MTINQLPVEDWSKTRENSAGETEPERPSRRATAQTVRGSPLCNSASRAGTTKALQPSITPAAMDGTRGEKPVNGIGADARES